MKFCSRILFVTVFLLTLSLIIPSLSLAATPDGLGPWADFVTSFHQGKQKNGLPVAAIRSNPSAALGVAEGTLLDGTFVSLGFGGKLVLGFDNGISGGVMSVESTHLPYPVEKAKIEMSSDSVHWFSAGTVSRSGTVNQPRELACAHFVRLTDVSDISLFSDATADGYDVDGVEAQGEPCAPTPTPSPVAGGCTSVSQSNTTQSSTTVISNASTGNNKANDNTGGKNTITTGDATSNTTIINGGSSNAANCVGGGNGGNTNVSVIGNGAGSHNTVIVTSN